MSRIDLLVLGAGGHAAACIDVIEQHGGYNIVGLVGAAAEVGKRHLGYEVLGTEEQLPALFERCPRALIGVGQIKTPDVRIRLFELLQRLQFSLPSIVSPRAHVSRHASLGAGSIVMHGAVVNAGARVGANCIVNSLALVEHDVVVGDHCHVATGAIINGGASLGAGTFLGSRSTIRQQLQIGARCVIGMGQAVLTDCPDNSHLPLPRTR